MSSEDVSSIVQGASLVLGLADRLIDAFSKGDIKRVEELLPKELLTTLAKQKAEALALEKFGA